MKFLHQLQGQKTQSPTAYSLVDVGRDTVKAAVALMIPGNREPQVVGFGLAETGNQDITGGRKAAEAVVNPVNKALTEAEDSAERYIGQKIVPDDVVFAVAGRAVFGKLFTVEQARTKASAPITGKEMKNIRLRAEKLVPKGLVQAAYSGGQWLPLAVTDAATMLDGRLVVGEVGLTGRKISHSVFGVAAQASALRGLEVLAEALNLSIANVVASPHALAALSPQTDAIILDIGFSGTDILLIRNDALTATDWVPFGGYFFTQALAQLLGLSAKAARTLKHAYGNGSLLGDQAERMAGHLEPAFQRWYNAVFEVFINFNQNLPRRIYLTGGASQMPGFERVLKINPAPFEAAPEVHRLGPTAIKDLTDSMNYNLMALALSLTVGIPEL
jgi:cell division ATPase FtsA